MKTKIKQTNKTKHINLEMHFWFYLLILDPVKVELLEKLDILVSYDGKKYTKY